MTGTQNTQNEPGPEQLVVQESKKMLKTTATKAAWSSMSPK